MPVDISFDAGFARASLVFRHPTGNILTLELMRQIRAALEDLLESRHLRLLKNAGLVSTQPQGTLRLYQLDDQGVRAVRAYLERVWGDAIGRLRLVAENTRPRRQGKRR